MVRFGGRLALYRGGSWSNGVKVKGDCHDSIFHISRLPGWLF